MAGWALITGATGNIGQAVGLELASHGWDIILHYRSNAECAQETAKKIQAMSREACLVEIDLSNPRLAETIIPSLAEELGMIDALINCAALKEPDSTDPDGSRHKAANFDAPRILAKAFRDHIPAKEKGAIVNLLDATPKQSDFIHYRESKDALAEMTLNMAKSFSPKVRVNGVSIAKNISEIEHADLLANKVAASIRTLLEDTTANGEIRMIAE